MTSVQSAFIAPITKLIGLRHFLWYAHTSNNIYLKIARALTDGIITSTPGSCPLDGRKIYPIGQSIDKNIFSRKAKVIWPITKLVHIGRFDPSKDIEVIINTVEKVRHSNSALTLEIIGSSSSDKFEKYEREVKNRYVNKPEYSWVKFTPHISRAELPEILKSKEAFIHAFQGSLDKTLVEATFTGLPVVTINNEYLKIFGFWHQRNQPESDFLEKELTKLLTLSESELQAEVDRRYEIAVGNHEISGWVDRLVSVLSGQAK
jgi:glycosyltransferase involved in cell wall biosynthesis